MPFSYRLRQTSVPVDRDVRKSTTLLVANLGAAGEAKRALRIARQLVEITRRDVVLLSDGRALEGEDVAGALETTAIDRLSVYDLMVAVGRGEQVRLSPRMISVVSALRLGSVRRINARGRSGGYVRPCDETARRALFVFPGLFTPPRIGSHQRAFSTVLDLLEDGFDVDILVKRRGAKLLERTRHYFALLSGRVSSYLVEETLEEGERPATSFEEREASDIDDGAKALVRDLVASAKYDVIVVSFPWMLKILDDAEPNGAMIVCDTHDVISNRWRELSAMSGVEAGPQDMFDRERDYLGRCDAVLAISRSDAKLFESSLGLPNVVVHPISYYDVEPVVQWRSTAGPLNFGFVGSDMEANRLALEFIMRRWWPIVEEFSPDSRLVIAGAIAESSAVSPYVILRENVLVAGFVEDLDGYFDQIDILLSPAMVKAGVNVKNVQALLRRRPVITNARGAASLAPIRIPTRCESDQAFRNLLRKLDRRDPGMVGALEACFDEAARYHTKPTHFAFA